MCIDHRREERWKYLTVALASCLVIDVIWSFEDGREPHHHAKDGIETIEEARKALDWIYTDHKSFSMFRILGTFKTFDDYEKVILLKKTVEGMKWKAWRSDLEQWLANKDKVLDFFGRLQSEANARTHRGGCFG